MKSAFYFNVKIYDFEPLNKQWTVPEKKHAFLKTPEDF